MMSPLQKARLSFKPKIPPSLANLELLQAKVSDNIVLKPEIAHFFPLLKTEVYSFIKGNTKSHFPLKVGIVFSGGPASGGHNVASGLFDALKQWHAESSLIGFLNGPSGIIKNEYKILTDEMIDAVRNQGGFTLLGTGRTKIETEEQFKKSMEAALMHQLDGLVVVGGDDSNTNAALLAEYFLANHVQTTVIGVPKTIDGDLKNEWIATSFGFDSASKTYSEIIGNALQDAASQNKYYFFVKVMGRTASNLVLECALKTHPQLTLIGEEIASRKVSLSEIVNEIADLIISRASLKKFHGVILIPEGVIEFIPEIKSLIQELNATLAKKSEVFLEDLSAESSKTLQSLPQDIQLILLKKRDPHGNIPVSQIETEKMLIDLVQNELKKRKFTESFTAQALFCGYEGRSCLPSNFDANYCYALGLSAALLIKNNLTGYMAVIQNLNMPVEKWIPKAVPLAGMITMEERKGKRVPVIKKGLVELHSEAFQSYQEQKKTWQVQEDFVVPGPIQFFGAPELTDSCPLTIEIK